MRWKINENAKALIQTVTALKQSRAVENCQLQLSKIAKMSTKDLLKLDLLEGKTTNFIETNKVGTERKQSA